ncbi:hypothetical protein BN426_5237 [Klebsiella pneumoniae subsp. pneumoniae ST258-K26BO]|nr:putative membrane protein [Klebsiella pneumoniae]EPS08719.1 hypothetical protein KKPNMP14_35940 [Klebsiella pneumoniae subsp. pneumoniae MP14]CCM85727.1 hypothetical protein BN426_5237 [Klebsiella pneumoniae subsp. pneumoniae ST258-K26BO]
MKSKMITFFLRLTVLAVFILALNIVIYGIPRIFGMPWIN